MRAGALRNIWPTGDGQDLHGDRGHPAARQAEAEVSHLGEGEYTQSIIRL